MRSRRTENTKLRDVGQVRSNDSRLAGVHPLGLFGLESSNPIVIEAKDMPIPILQRGPILWDILTSLRAHGFDGNQDPVAEGSRAC